MNENYQACPSLIAYPSCEKYSPSKFHHLCAKHAKQQEHYESKIYDQYFIKTIREVPGRPRENPKIIV